MKNQAYAERTNEKMKEVLMNPAAAGPEIHYYMIRGGSKKKNITVWESGTVGGEYIKAYGHYHIDDFIETYWVLEGQGLLLLQMRKKDSMGKFIDDEIDSFEAISVRAGSKIVIPPFAGHLMINTGSTWLATSDDSPVNFDAGDSASQPAHADYEPLRKLNGFAYYVIEKNGRPEFVKNPNYKTIPDITHRTA
ncbi:MAG: glucose-6-phosphate isomerase family protein [Patescibacteria group bacterium]